MNNSTEHIMPCGHGSRFLVVDPIMGCGTGLANHYCGECERIAEAEARIEELEAQLAKANETIKWARIVSEHSQIKQEPGA